MKIIVLDGYTLNPGDLSWEGMKSLGELTVYDRTPPGLTVERAQGAEIVLTNKTVLSADIIEQLTELQYIGVLATGYNVVDTEAAARRGIPVTNIPEYGTQSVAQMVFAHLLNLCNHATEHSQSVRDGKWCASEDFCYWDFPLVELAEKTMGIIGLGRIGSSVASIAKAFGMVVIAFDPTVSSPPGGISLVNDVDAVFKDSDVVSLHCPLTEKTQGLVNRERLSLMKPTAFLINTSRGPLIDESALAEALVSGTIAGAGLDVLHQEPPAADNPLLLLRQYITLHTE